MTEPGIWFSLADLVLAIHAAYVLFVVGGQILIIAGWALGWMWTRHIVFRLLHLGAIGFVMVESWIGLTCPLTALENSLRVQADAKLYEKSFIGHWLERLIFYPAPEWVFTLIYTVFAALVILTWLANPPRRKFINTHVSETDAK